MSLLYDDFREDVSQLPWNIIDIFDDVNAALETWYLKCFLDVIDKHLHWQEKGVKKTTTT